MQRILYKLLAAMAFVASVAVVGTSSAFATLSADYQVVATTGTYTTITGLSGTVTAIAGSNSAGAGGTFNDTASAGPFNIGFAFQFDCLAYTQFSVSTNGTVYLGSQKSGSPANDLASAPRYPIIAPWWDHQHTYNNGGSANGCSFTPTEGVHYRLTGTAPNRVLTVEFNTQVYDNNGSAWWAGCGLTMNRYQVRLYEGSNKIEYHYSSLWASSGQPTSATIGIANGTTNFISVTPSAGTITTSSVVSNNGIAQHTALIPANTLYTFTPCYINRAGTSGVSSPAMAPGDTVMNGALVLYGDEGTYTPFTLSFPAGACPTHNYTLTVSGANATEYRFTATNNQTWAGTISAGSTLPVGMIFRPGGVGPRQAFLTITDNTIGCSVIFTLLGTGMPRLGVTGNIAQGGTAAMASGDTLFKAFHVQAGSSNSWTPFTASNLSSMGFAPNMAVTYTLSGANASMYTITPNNTSLASAQTNTPSITFNPPGTAAGPQPATLTISGDGITKVYTLYPTVCFAMFTGLTGAGNGGTATLSNGDTFFGTFSAVVGNAAVYTPFFATMDYPSCSGSYSMTISGTAAADYYFGTVGTQNITRSVTPGQNDTAKITFRPSALGVRNAVLIVTSSGGFTRTYNLAATGDKRIVLTGNPAQGGSAPMNSGDTLLKSKSVVSGTSQGFQPFTATNISTMNMVPGALVNYAITGGSGQYSIAPPSVTLNSGQSNTPTLTFAPIVNNLGPQPATLTITADGQAYTYPLYATALAARSEFQLPNPGYNVRGTGSNNSLVPTTETFFDLHLCAGESVSPLQINVVSQGNYPVSISNITVLELDTTVGQGFGPYPPTNRVSRDYIFTAGAGTSPYSANTPFDYNSLSIAPGSQATMYLNFVPQRTGKRYARAYIQTNSQNFSGTNAAGATVLGLLTFDMYGVGEGAIPSSPGSNYLKPVIFPDTKVGTSSTVWAYVTNRGTCDLRIDKRKFELVSGDISAGEYAIITKFSSPVDANGNYVLAPGAVDSVQIRYSPIHIGSRRATMLLQTNDSMFNTNGNTERGAYYWDVFGIATSSLGITFLKDGNTVFPPGVIDGNPNEVSAANAELRNTLTNAITIVKVSIVGQDSADFSIDPTTPIGPLPKLLTPAELLNLRILFKPAPGSQPGIRNAMLQIVLESGDTVISFLSAEAGTRVLSVSPNALFDNVVLPVGTLLRRTVEVKNTGTLSLTLTGVQITGVDSLAYSITPMARNLLVGGQTEYVEITFKPIAAGTTVAKFEASGNQTNGKQTVTLGGKAVRTKGVVDPSDVTSRGVDGGVKMGLDENTGTKKSDADLKFKK